MILTKFELERFTGERIAALTDPSRLLIPTDWRRPRPPSQRGFVYFLRAAVNGDVKLGFTRNVPARHREIAKAHSRPVVLLCVIQPISPHDDGRELERALFLRFASYRIKGEWFAADGDFRAWLDQLVARTNGAFA